MGQVPDAMAAELGEAVVLDAPVTAVTQDGDRVDVMSERGDGDGAPRPCSRCPARWPPASASSPRCPADHARFIHQMPAGTELKMVAIYDEPFWRADGANGRHGGDRRTGRGDAGHDPARPRHGVLATYAAGPRARALWALGEKSGVRTVVRTLSTRLGPRAAPPLELLELNWAEERWTRGCSFGRFPTGVLTQYGRRSASRSGACTGPARRRRRRRSDRWTARCARASGSARRSWRRDEAAVGTFGSGEEAESPNRAGPGPGPHPIGPRPGAGAHARGSRGRRSASGPGRRGSACPSWSTRWWVRTECAFLGCP